MNDSKYLDNSEPSCKILQGTLLTSKTGIPKIFHKNDTESKIKTIYHNTV